MAEVTRQLGPLEDKIDRATNSIERLFNSNGGPPGYLQTARAEDNKRFETVFKILEEHKLSMRPLSARNGSSSIVAIRRPESVRDC